ncbi:Poly(A) polymerase, RNA-binding domain [Dillenia turbinata]|uniref:Poly(A) polymerase, RNA-binding domain n=1 Tax=Dillenia turbinata TaxID=194707 RepID=A0AAN8V1L4_9MAGN
MGLQLNQGSEAHECKQLDLRSTVEEFKNSVNFYSFWKPGMWINVCHAKRRNIPDFVFPGGIWPSYCMRAAGEGGITLLFSESSVTCKASFSTGGSSSSEEAENLLRRRICGPTVSSLDTIELDELRDKTGLLEREQDTGQGAKSNMPVISSAKASVARTVATGLEELEPLRFPEVQLALKKEKD